MINVRWDSGGETTIIPGPGVLSVVARGRRVPSAPRAPATSGATKATRRTIAASSRDDGARKAVAAKKVAPGKKAAPGKKSVTKGTSSSRTTGKKTR
ncbi:MAG: hypothetical protein ACLQAN_02800 [Acidimicrobiales bacterium]